MIEITTGIVFLLSSLYANGANSQNMANTNTISSTSTGTSTAEVISVERKLDRKTIEKYVRTEYANTPILIEIARCESTFMQYDKDGNVVRGRVNSADIGVMQINEKYHLDTATKLGLDLHTVEGNVAYAKLLYRDQGASPWSASSGCWGKVSDHLAINK